MSRYRALIVSLAVASGVLSSCGETALEPVGEGGVRDERLDPAPAFSFAGDTIPCPENSYGLIKCTEANDELPVMLHEANRIIGSAAGECLEAGQRIRDVLMNDPVYMHYHEEGPPALIATDGSVGPPHPVGWLQVAWYAVWPEHVGAGSLLRALYHEGAHILGYSDAGDAAENFAVACVEEYHIEEKDEVEYTGGEGGGGGGDDCQCDWNPEYEYCVVRYWYWKDTGEIISYQVLYCY
jgi:hypothetical protein